MKNTFFTFLFLLVTQNLLIAQKNMVAGFIVKLSGDTIRGKIDDKDWNRNPTKIIFSTDDEGIKTYNIVKELVSFGVDNKSVYVTKKASLDITPNTYGSLLKTKERIVIADTLIVLKSLVKGKISLYFFKDANGKEHFFVEKLNEPLEELIEHQYLSESEGKQGVVTEDIYNTQLAELCQDCSLFNGMNFNYQFTQSSLKPAILKYNGFFGDKTAHETSKKEYFSSNLFVQITGGMYSYRTEFGYVYTSNESYFFPSLGLGWLIELPSNRRRLAIKMDATYTVLRDTQRYSYTLLEKRSHYFGLSLSPQYYLYKNKELKKALYVTAGLNWETPLNNTDNTNYYYVRNYGMLGYKVGIGFRINRLNMEGSYANTATSKQNTFDKNSIYRMMFTVGYALF
jgi:hypothetical protein